MHGSSSVLMAEAGGLAIAARCARLLSIQEMSFSDSETLANIINDRFRSSKPWSIKPFTADFSFQALNMRFKVLKINRVDNVTAHSLASQARSSASPARTVCMYLPVLLVLFSYGLLWSLSPFLM